MKDYSDKIAEIHRVQSRLDGLIDEWFEATQKSRAGVVEDERLRVARNYLKIARGTIRRSVSALGGKRRY